MLPYCFKTYPDKSSSWPELMALFKMNLIEFTPGYGSEKYTEVNRILANRAADTGGCIVARSQMHNIIEERPTLDRTVEKRCVDVLPSCCVQAPTRVPVFVLASCTCRRGNSQQRVQGCPSNLN
ncbi:unnamed protein product [Cylicostephanus goldi]|uniref:RNase NYN domain-containing protein n=1 Tax=Cylicostephanus goldi TaxID=71465 RepID=A0A3P6USU3_CYLGO|nr:unnamed protein product [Cylicostephanus goldi]